MRNRPRSWYWVIFWLIIFWPVGLYYLLKKLSSDNSAAISGGSKTASIVGWALLLIGVFGLFYEIFSNRDSYAIVIAIMLIVGGGILILKMAKSKKRALKYRQYINVIVNQKNRKISNIAAIVGLSSDEVATDLQDMIHAGYLAGAYINQSTHEIVLRQDDAAATTIRITRGASSAQERVVHCPGCGMDTVVTVGSVSRCEYCDSLING